MRIFLSHIHEEVTLAGVIKEELLSCFGRQVDVFLAEDIPLGSNWLNEIRSALANADMVLVLFSPISSSRPWINIEAGYGFMAGKQVLPLCHSGFRKSDLPIIYGLLQAVDPVESEDVGKLLDQIAKSTPAGSLLVDRSAAIQRWISIISEASMRVPVMPRRPNQTPCVWIMGSNRGLGTKQARMNVSFVRYLAQASIRSGLRLVFGRSELLDQIGTTSTTKPDSGIERSTLSDFANASAMVRNAAPATPNPVVILGSLRAKRGVRAIFRDAIGCIPDVAVVIGGSLRGRASEEVMAAKLAGIPVLPLSFTGGCAAKTEHSFGSELAPHVTQVQAAKHDLAFTATQVCELILKQACLPTPELIAKQ